MIIFKTKEFTQNTVTNKRIYWIIMISIFSLLFLTIFFISIFNNGFKFTSDGKEILEFTLLKTLIGLLCGFGLTTAGCAMQGITRNDLAGPTTMGLIPAASLGILIYQLINFVSVPIKILLSLVFSFLIFLVNFFTMKYQNNGSKNYKLILIGIIFGALLTTISTIITSLVPYINQTIISWIGLVDIEINWENFIYCGPLVLLGILIISFLSKNLNIIENDYALAKSLGLNVELTLWLTGIGTIFITVSSVIMVGSITMIGIVIPHLVRMLFKTRNYKFIIPVSGFISSTILIFSLWINARYSLGLNLFSTIVSVPLFLYIIFRDKKV